jgi:hypothetical protein
MDRRDLLKGATLAAGVVATAGTVQGVSATQAAAQTGGVGIRDIPAIDPAFFSCSIPAHCIDPHRLPLFIARSALRDLIAGLRADAEGVQTA